MQRYGYKIATDVISKHVATGQIYKKGEVICRIKSTDLIKRLCNAGNDVLKEDIKTQNERAKAAK